MITEVQDIAYSAMDYSYSAKGTRIDYWVKKEEVEYQVVLLSKNNALFQLPEESLDNYLGSRGAIFTYLLLKGMDQAWKPTKKGSMTTFVCHPEIGMARLFIKQIE